MVLISSKTAAKAAPSRQIHVSLECCSSTSCTAAGMCLIIQIANSQVVSDSRAQTDLKDGSAHTQMGDAIPRTTSSALLPTTRLRRSTPRTIHRMPELDSGPTAYNSWKVSTRRPHLLRSPSSTIIKDDRPHHPAHSPQRAIAPRG